MNAITKYIFESLSDTRSAIIRLNKYVSKYTKAQRRANQLIALTSVLIIANIEITYSDCKKKMKELEDKIESLQEQIDFMKGDAKEPEPMKGE